MISRRGFMHCSFTGLSLACLKGNGVAASSSSNVSGSASHPAVKRDYWNDWPAYMTQKWREARSLRQVALQQLTSQESLRSRSNLVHTKVWELIGGQLEKTPLNPQVIGKVERNGYVIEKVIFESQPQVYVTSLLYLPSSGKTPYPGILFSMGHAPDGKSYRRYQHMAQTLVRNGYAVLAFDPFGQGERIQYLDKQALHSRLGDPIYEHTHPGKQLLLLGTTFTQLRAWDGVRALDYLLSRPEVDAGKIGCVGHSGGGTMTMYLAALEPRIHVAVSVEGNFSNFTGNSYSAPGAVADAEQNMIGSLPLGIDRGDLLLAFAPKPLLMCFTPQDYASNQPPDPKAAPLEMYGELKKAYALGGASDRVGIFQATLPHDFDYSCRKAALGWFNRWLARKDRGTDESALESAPPETLYCTRTGQVLTSLRGRSVVDLIRERTQKTLAKTSLGNTSSGPEEKRQKDLQSLRKMLVLPHVRQPLQTQILSSTEQPGLTIDEFHFFSEPSIRIPGWFAKPRSGRGPLPVVLAVTDSGKDQAVLETGLMMDIIHNGVAACIVDLRGLGESAPQPSTGGWAPLEDRYAWAGFVLGRPVLGQRVWDVLRCLDYLESRPDVDRNRISVYGAGGAGLAAMIGAALDKRIHSLLLDQVLASFHSVVESEDYALPLSWFVYSILRELDLPNIVAALAPRTCWLVNSLDAEHRSISEATAHSTYQHVRQCYEGVGNSDRFRVLIQPEEKTTETLHSWLSALSG